MRTFNEAENGWLAGTPASATVKAAQERMAARDRVARNLGVTSHFESDLRWVGDLGEIAFQRWLRDEQLPFQWNGGVDGKPDFTVGDNPVGLKTRYSKVPTRADFYAVVPDQHLQRQQESEWFFANYEVGPNRLVLLGGVDAGTFRERAKFVNTGEPIGPTTRARNPVWQLDVSLLDVPTRWLCGLAGHRLDGTTCYCGAFAL